MIIQFAPAAVFAICGWPEDTVAEEVLAFFPLKGGGGVLFCGKSPLMLLIRLVLGVS